MKKTTPKSYAVTLLRIIGGGMRNFFRNLWLSTAATAIMIVTLTILLTSYTINSVLEDSVQDIAQNITVSVFLEDDIENQQRLELQTELEQGDNVKSIEYIDKDQALRIFNERNEGSEVLEGVAIVDNVFPASLEVTLIDLTDLDSVLAITNQERFKDTIDETSVNEVRRKSIDNIASAQDFINGASLVTAAIFAGISVLVIFNTIRMAVFTRSDEIEIMKLIGATRSYIRGPFLTEAAFYGFVAGVLTYAAVYGTLLFVGPKLSSSIIIDPTIDHMVARGVFFFFVTVGIGVLIGLVSAWLATNKYLRLKKW